MQEIGGYRLERRLGAGGMGTVWRAYDADGRAVAFKLLHPHISKDPSARARLTREVELLHRVRGPRVAQVMDAEVDDDDAFVVTELIEGPTLAQDVHEEGPFNERELTGLAIGLAEALRSIHEVGVVHRDLKPGNVMMSPTGPVIIDFGIAQIADDTRLTQTGMVTGTPGYLDPEIINGGDVTETCDWWSWAAVLVFAATGRQPYGSGPALAVVKRMSDHAVDLEGVEPLCARALRAALHPDPERRLDSESVIAVLSGNRGEQELETELEELMDDGVPASIPPRDGATSLLDEATLALGPRENATALVAPPVDPALGPPGAAPAGMATYPGVLGVPAGPGAPTYSAPGTPWWGDPVPAPDPPPPWAIPARPYRTLVACIAVMCVALAALYPMWSVALIAVLVSVAGTVGRAAAARRAWTAERGTRRGDTARTIAAIPLHVVISLLVAGAAIAVVLAIAWAVPHLAVPEGGAVPAAPYLWATAAGCAILAWWGPGARPAREGARIAVRGMLRSPILRAAVGLSTLAVAGVVVVLVLGRAGVQWFPLADAPVPFLTSWP